MPPKAKKAVSVVDRRLASGSIFSASSRPIPLTEPERWEIRIVNTQISDNRLWEMQADKGWIYAEPGDIAVNLTELGFRVMDGRIVRGTQGAEVLMKMEKSDYRKIAAHKDAENRTRTFGKKALKQDIVAAAGQLSDQGADFLNRNINQISVNDSREMVSLEE